MDASPWNSLEIAKLVAGLLTPLTVAGFGIYVHRVTKRFEQIQWQSQKLIEKRLEIYEALATKFNSLLCYYTYVGAWRDVEPTAIVEMKRELDKSIYLAAPLFNEEFFKSCIDFQQICFTTYNGWGKDALLRTHFERRREARGAAWKSEWEELFDEVSPSDPQEIRIAYGKIMNSFAKNIGVNHSAAVIAAGLPPSNVR